MKTQLTILAAATALAGAGLASAQQPMTAALSADRPAADTARDADRKPAEMVAFAGIKPGATVADLIPGGGYFTRVFAKAVGPTGKVHAVVPAAMLTRNPKAADGVNAIAAEPAYRNVTVQTIAFEAMAPDSVDVAWTSLNYHDINNNDPAMATAFAGAVLKALKPGGAFVVVDHAAAAGASDAVAKPLHRIDPAKVKAQLTAAGFTYDGESKALANPADTHDKPVFDPALRGHTDQFALKFKKPA